MCLKHIEKKKLLRRHNEDILFKHLCKTAVYLLLKNTEAATGGAL